MISYISIILIPLLIGVIAYKEALKVVVNDTHEINMSTLDQARAILDQRFTEVDSFVTFLSVSTKTKDIMSLTDPYEVGAVQKIFDVKEFLSIYSVTNTFMKNFYIHFAENDIILSPYTTSTQGRNFYGSFFKYGNMNADEWYNDILSKYRLKEYLPVTNVSIGGHHLPMLVYIQSIPVDSTFKTKGAVIVLIDIQKINSYLEPLNIKDGGWAYITDSQGNIVTMLGSDNSDSVIFDLKDEKGHMEKMKDGKRMIVVYTTSSYNGWKYVSVLPYDVAMDKVQYIKGIIYIIAAISLLFSLLAALFLAHRNSKPICELIQTLQAKVGQDYRKASTDYEYLNKSITEIIDYNSTLKEKVDKQLPYLKIMFLDRLLNSKFINFDEVGVFLEHVGIDAEGMSQRKVVSSIVWINTYQGQVNNEILQELNIVKATFKDHFTRLIGEHEYILDIDFDKVAMILIIKKEHEESYKEYMEKLLHEINNFLLEMYNIKILFACGSIKDNLLEAGNSFEEAKKTLDYMTHVMTKSLMWYEDCAIDSKGYYYSLETEMRLMSLVKLGEFEMVKKVLQDIYTENFSNRTLSSEMGKHLIYDIKGTIIKLLDQIRFNDSQRDNIKEMLDDLGNSILPEDTFNNIRRVFLFMCSVIVEEKQSTNSHLKKKLVDYINQNFSSSQLSLKGTADDFSLTEAFLSQFFKVHMNLCFSDYVETIRMDKACELLKYGELNINDISEKLGYNSPHSFRRAFKRVKGVNPALYREEASMKLIEENMQ